MDDFDGYLARIGLDPADSPSWPAIHRAHVISIPFENLDPHRGTPISLEQADLERKLVAQRRGGYCFEHNLLLASALEHLGLEVELMLARVRSGGAPPEGRPPTHLVLRVTDEDGAAWHADVGFGNGTLFDPIPFGAHPDVVHEQSGWSFRVVEDGAELVLQTLGADGWSDVYGFEPRPVFRIDVELSNWWTCTNPRSPFVFGLIAAVNHDDGSREVLSDWSGPLQLRAMAPDGIDVSEQPRSAIPAKLEQFGLPGFSLGDDERVR
ncbi:MAG TPA: arylamine N-acetyltransferase [Solirubrobacteraceae bacterium]|nr:arylamine N-acetyltransferase [Solirubrobacteraceae bacterium]